MIEGSSKSTLKFFTWNLEGLKRNIFNLKHLTDLVNPDLAFLSEPNVFSHDADSLMTTCMNKYNYSINSEDKYDQESAFTKNKTSGGTMVLWRTELDPYITVFPVSTTSFLPVIYSPPDSAPSIHISIYLPTSGQEKEFVNEITELKMTIDELLQKYPESVLYLRGDSNVNPNNKTRARIFANFCKDLNLNSIPTKHRTYHHFIGQGLFDSSIDVVLQSSSATDQEVILQIYCQNDFPEIDSHHDAIVSTVALPPKVCSPSQDFLKPAPRVENMRHRIVWNEDRLADYQALVGSQLSRIRSNWSRSDSPVSVSILLDLTNKFLSQTASATNRSIPISSSPKPRNLKIPRKVIEARNTMNSAHRAFKRAKMNNSPELSAIKKALRDARKNYRFVSRREIHEGDIRRDTELFSVFTSSSPAIFK